MTHQVPVSSSHKLEVIGRIHSAATIDAAKVHSSGACRRRSSSSTPSTSLLTTSSSAAIHLDCSSRMIPAPAQWSMNVTVANVIAQQGVAPNPDDKVCPYPPGGGNE